MNLDDLRRRAQDAGRAEEWEELLTLADQLRTDTDQWIVAWAPSCAVAARMLGRDDEGRALLREAIDGGFFQPELFEPEITTVFGGDPDWPAVRAAMVANLVNAAGHAAYVAQGTPRGTPDRLPPATRARSTSP